MLGKFKKTKKAKEGTMQGKGRRDNEVQCRGGTGKERQERQTSGHSTTDHKKVKM